MAKTRVARQSTLTILAAAVAAHYQKEGDRTRAGVVVAVLDYDPPMFYASVARYPDGPHHKRIVVSTHDQKHHLTAEQAIDDLARRWYKLVSPPPVEATLDALAAQLKEG